MELLHTREQGISQIRVKTRFMVPMCDTKTFKIDDASALRRRCTSDSGKRTAGGDSTSACRHPQPGQHNSTGDHGTKPPSGTFYAPRCFSKREVEVYHRPTGCQCETG